jgi:hypothetical protein
MAEPLIPGRRRLPAGGAGLRRRLAPLAPLWSGARAEALFPLPTRRERPARNEGVAA